MNNPLLEKPVEETSYRHLFLGLSVALVLLTVWAVYDETVSRRPWKKYQKEFQIIEYAKVNKDFQKFLEGTYNAKRVAELHEKLKVEEAQLDQSKEYQEAMTVFKKADIIFSDRVNQRRAVKSEYDEAAYEFTHAKQTKSNRMETYRKVMEAVKKEVDEATKHAAETQDAREAAKANVDKLNAVLRGLREEWEKLEGPKLDFEERLARIKGRSVEIHQMIIPGLQKIDRCLSCHVGVNKKGFDAPDIPKVHRSHPGMDLPLDHPKNILARHPFDKYGCTVCHRGDGEATKELKAHGYHQSGELVHHMMEPMIKKEYLQASCAKCHQVTTGPGMEVVQKGKDLFKKYGCLACHKASGWERLAGWEGGSVSVDLAEIADKTQDEIDYGFVEPPHTWDSYMVQRLMNSQKVNPARPEQGIPYDSPMPNYHLSKDDATAIATLLHAFSRETKNMPAAYKVAGKALQEPEPKGVVAAGRQVFVKYGCGGCHGLNGEGGHVNYNYEGGPTKEQAMMPKLQNLADKYTDAELEERINLGTQPEGKFDPHDVTPPLFMPKWKGIISKSDMHELVQYLKTIKGKKEKGAEEW